MQVAPDREVALPNMLTGSLTSYRWRTRAGRMRDADAAVSSAGPRAPPGGAELKGRRTQGSRLAPLLHRKSPGLQRLSTQPPSSAH